MDSSDPASFNHRVERLSTGRKYHFVDQVPQWYDPVKTPTLLCVHGFPDLWYGWRYVIIPWVQQCGWRVVVPDMLGYGGTDKPIGIENYTTKSLSSDLAALLDLIGVQKAVVLGHDWGASTVWRFALWYPERIRALVTLSIPFAPRRPDYISLEQIVERLPIYGYQLYFNHPSSTQDIENNVSTNISGQTARFIHTGCAALRRQLAAFITVLHRRPTGVEHTTLGGNLRSRIVNEASRKSASTLLNPKDLEYYLEIFEAGGMNGPLNYYRTTKHKFDEEEAGNLATHLPASLPVLFLWGDKDPTCSPSQVERMHNHVPCLRVVRVPDEGHWLMVECPDVVVNNVTEFVRGVCRESEKAKL